MKESNTTRMNGGICTHMEHADKEIIVPTMEKLKVRDVPVAGMEPKSIDNQVAQRVHYAPHESKWR